MADRSSYPSEQADKFLLRLPDGMRDRLKAEAEANKRSMNAEIVARLDFTLELPERHRKQSEQYELYALRQDYEIRLHQLQTMQEQVMRAAEGVERLSAKLAETEAKYKKT